jgi:hypothetical protein
MVAVVGCARFLLIQIIFWREACGVNGLMGQQESVQGRTVKNIEKIKKL